MARGNRRAKVPQAGKDERPHWCDAGAETSPQTICAHIYLTSHVSISRACVWRIAAVDRRIAGEG